MEAAEEPDPQKWGAVLPSCVGQALIPHLFCTGRPYDGGEEPALWLLPGFCSLGEWADLGMRQGPSQTLSPPCGPGDQEAA